MALRFIDTNFYKSPFIRGLNGASKGLYSFIICDCKASGIWAKDLEIASLYIGLKLTDKDFDCFIKSGKAIDLKDGNYFFPDFIEHQYPKGLSDKNPAHNNIIIDLKKYGLIDDSLKVLPSTFNGTKVMVMDMVKETETETVKVIAPENKNYYRSFDKLNITHDKVNELLKLGYSQIQVDDILDAIENYKNNKNYKDLFLTAKTWLKKEYPNIKPAAKKVISLTMYPSYIIYCHHCRENKVEPQSESEFNKANGIN